MIRADRAICTFSLPVLSKMDWIKSLPPAKQHAIREMGYWHLSRMIYHVQDRYWKKEGLNGMAATDHPMEIWDPQYESDAQAGMIAAYIKHDDSSALMGKTDEEKLAFGQSRINDVFPGLNDVLVNGYVKHWGEDPWALSAHSIGNRNHMTTYLPEIMKSEGRIHFAGEHASAYHGWMQGAIESGARTAKEINEAE